MRVGLFIGGLVLVIVGVAAPVATYFEWLPDEGRHLRNAIGTSLMLAGLAGVNWHAGSNETARRWRRRFARYFLALSILVLVFILVVCLAAWLSGSNKVRLY